MSKLVVTMVGPATSVQDAGRYGAQRYGMTPSGAMDRLALAIANNLVGNPLFSAAIEIGPLGAAFTARDGAIRVALAGAQRRAKAGEQNMALHESFTLAEGDSLTLGAARDGVFSYLAIEGGVNGEPTFGSLAVNARAGLGSPYPRALQPGDELQVATASHTNERAMVFPARAEEPIRVVLGPQNDEFDDDIVQLFLRAEWKISGTSDRMGYRLEGPATIRHKYGHNVVSDGTVNGSIQVPGSGQPIVLMPDRGTSGGYPKIATVISADIGRFAQIPAGRNLRFKAVSIHEAQAAARTMSALLHDLPNRLREPTGLAFDIEALQNANVAGVAVNAFDAGTWQTDASPEHQP